tara:strand:+ start:36 stop:275 length:240 start_codon:yes stop_codon:yes gene_type:complete
MNTLSNDLIIYIKGFLFTKCGECMKERYVNEMEYNVTTIYYKAIFDDDFPFPRIYKSYKYLCNNCINELNEKLIAPLKY